MTILSNKDIVKIVGLGDVKELDVYFNKLSAEIKCTYLTYMVERGNQKIYFSSNEDWQSVFIREQLINACPIYRNAFIAAESRKFVFTAWDHVQHMKGIEQDVMDLRMSFNIAHGVGLAIKNDDGVRESLVFAGRTDNKYFHESIARDSNLIHGAIRTFRGVFKVK